MALAPAARGTPPCIPRSVAPPLPHVFFLVSASLCCSSLFACAPRAPSVSEPPAPVLCIAPSPLAQFRFVSQRTHTTFREPAKHPCEKEENGPAVGAWGLAAATWWRRRQPAMIGRPRCAPCTALLLAELGGDEEGGTAPKNLAASLAAETLGADREPEPDLSTTIDRGTPPWVRTARRCSFRHPDLRARSA